MIIKSTGILIGNNVVFHKDKILKKELDKIKKFVIKETTYMDEKIEIPLFRITTKYIIIPKFIGINFDCKFNYLVNNNNIINKNMNEITDYKITLKDYQKDIYNNVINNILCEDNIKNGIASAILKIPTGYGKTYIATSFINHFSTKTLIVVPSSGLVSQWKNILKNNFKGIIINSNLEKKINIDEINKSDIFITTVQWLLNKNGKELDYSSFEFVIWDECHSYSGPKFSTIMSIVKPLIQIGLSATPEKGKEIITTSYLGKFNDFDISIDSFKMDVRGIEYNMTLMDDSNLHILEKVNDLNENDEEEFCVPNMLIVRDLKHKLQFLPTLSNIFQSQYRKSFIINLIINTTKLNQNFYVFCKRINEVQYYYNILKKLLPNKIIAKADGKSKNKNIEKDLETCNIMITTDKKLGTGISSPRMTGIIFASDMGKNPHLIKQLVGRILRNDIKYIKEKRFVYDIIDKGFSFAENHYKIREKDVYRKLPEIMDIYIKLKKIKHK